jgi:hypothetical protein
LSHSKPPIFNRNVLEDINEEPSYREENSNIQFSMVIQKNLLMEESKGETQL